MKKVNEERKAIVVSDDTVAKSQFAIYTQI